MTMEYYNLSTTEPYLTTPSMYSVTSDLVNNIKNNPYDELLATTNSSDPEPSTIVYENLKSLTRYLNTYFTPVIIIAGTIGNILSVMVFLRTKLKKLSSNFSSRIMKLFHDFLIIILYID